MQNQPAEQPSLLAKLARYLGLVHHKNVEIHISGDDKAIDALVHFFYHGDYLPTNYSADKVRFDLDTDFHAEVLRVATAYDVLDLMVLAKNLKEKASRAVDAQSAEEVTIRHIAPDF